MPDSSSQDHDQRLKVLLKEFFEEFFQCFFSDWAKRFDFSDLTWLDKEVFLAPPQGEKRQLDLVARLRIRPDAPPPQPDLTELVALIHVEIESRESVQQFRPRMFEYYTQLRRDSGLPVLPIGLYLRVGLEGTGWDAYEEHFWDHCLLRFEYAYVGLPSLEAEKYASGEHLLGVALSALMRTPRERRVELHAESLKRIALSNENDLRRFLLAECREAYVNLDESQRQQFEALLDTEHYRETKPLMITTYERGKADGKLEGKAEGKAEGKIEERREMVLFLLGEKFGPLTSEVQQRITDLTPERLRQLLVDIVKAPSLKELHLED
ncbi:MAG TPA: hypothetical protein VG122_25035 [Gemmata sp.]|jgi:hypothetical protein|nr:hypothetical protein [Gemmata sp.]